MNHSEIVKIALTGHKMPRIHNARVHNTLKSWKNEDGFKFPLILIQKGVKLKDTDKTHGVLTASVLETM